MCRILLTFDRHIWNGTVCVLVNERQREMSKFASTHTFIPYMSRSLRYVNVRVMSSELYVKSVVLDKTRTLACTNRTLRLTAHWTTGAALNNATLILILIEWHFWMEWMKGGSYECNRTLLYAIVREWIELFAKNPIRKQREYEFFQKQQV